MDTVAASAMISATGVLDIDRSTVSTPATMLAGAALSQAKLSGIDGALNGSVPVKATRKVFEPSLPAIVTGVFGVRGSRLLVAGSVV